MGDSANTKMKIVNSVLLLIAAALCIQAMTNDADLAEMGGEDESAGLGRRGGGGILTSSGSFVLSANRAGNDEEELGDTDTPVDQAEQEPSSPLLEHDGAREGLASSRSLLGTKKDDGTCPEGKILSARNFKVLKNGTKVPGGMCVPLPKLEDFKIGPSVGYGAPAGVLCSDSGCRTCAGEKCGTSQDESTNWVKMNGATKPADKIACSRSCLFGGSLTEVKDLQRYNNPTSKTGERSTRNLVATKVDSRFATKKHRTGIGGGMSSPICSFYKTTMCTNSTNCDVHKEVSCVAIVPASIGVGKYSGGGSSRQLAAYRNECKHAINPCGNLPMLV